ncbi:MAG: ABC transporter ATP-binding protein [Pirellulaceae bacterium]|nr:ABC transporter ATP-binding protein [Pirellulaceae bacterium]
MASDVAIRVENLSKKFRIGTGNSPAYHRLSEALTGIPRMAWNSLFPPRPEPTALAAGSSAPPANDFWALKDVSFEVKQGEVVGIIGRNGAGKSTLLKILSRITEPTSGRFGVRGRVASLLEVGTGFHPELTGRENIFVSGITLGMTRAEINKRFDEIVDFSGVEKFLDTPAKHYSSGMQVRLGFAVAAHLESEILIVDEVLAVGDAEFQKKCLGKMERSARSGRTIIFVSHNISAVERLCERGILLVNGCKTNDGKRSDVVSEYVRQHIAGNFASVTFSSTTTRLGSSEFASIRRLTLIGAKDKPTRSVRIGDPMDIEVEIEFKSPIFGPEIGVAISTEAESRISRFVSLWETAAEPNERGIYIYRIRVDEVLLVPGPYTLTPWVKRANDTVDDMIEGALSFDVESADVTGYAPYFERYCKPGEVYTPSQWTKVKVAS